MFRRLIIGCVVAAGALWLLSWSVSERPAAIAHEPATHTVTIAGMRFDPEVLTINDGDTVIWLNKDMFPHTATSKGAGFDSQQIAANESWRRRFERKGDYPYVCALHPSMTASIRVR